MLLLSTGLLSCADQTGFLVHSLETVCRERFPPKMSLGFGPKPGDFGIQALPLLRLGSWHINLCDAHGSATIRWRVSWNIICDGSECRPKYRKRLSACVLWRASRTAVLFLLAFVCLLSAQFSSSTSKMMLTWKI